MSASLQLCTLAFLLLLLCITFRAFKFVFIPISSYF
nr:MAG TPA: Serine-rich and transmembrane domain-containing protein 1 [Caudoviricetes sp.]